MRTGALRITHVVVSPQFHGTERYVVEAANGLSRRGHRVSVVGGEATVMRQLLDPGVEHHRGHDGRSALVSLSRLGRQDVVHAHLLRSERIATLAAPVNRGRRLVTEHLVRILPAGALGRAQEAVLRQTTHQRIAVSRAIADEVPGGAATLHNGVRSSAVRRRDDEHHDGGRVLVAQRLHHSKDTTTAVLAWAASGLAADGWCLQIAGAGPEERRVRATVEDLGMAGSVDLLGWRSDVHALMERADVLLAPAAVEPLGLSVLEAMARGVPVVASRAAGHLETVGGLDDARLFDVGDVDHAASLLRDLAHDHDGRADYGERLRQVQRRWFDQEQHVEALEALYRATCSRKRSGA